jgi:hypothetical protein
MSIAAIERLRPMLARNMKSRSSRVFKGLRKLSIALEIGR